MMWLNLVKVNAKSRSELQVKSVNGLLVVVGFKFNFDKIELEIKF